MTNNPKAEILKIALCGKYQEMYSDIETLCNETGQYDSIAEVKRWKYHSGELNIAIIDLILDYIRDYETERYDKAVYLYNKNKK